MAGRGRRAWLSVLLGLVLGFLLASRLVLPRASELKAAAAAAAGQRRRASLDGCRLRGAGAGALLLRRESRGASLWPRQDPAAEPPGEGRSFLFVGVMTAQKYLRSRAVAAHR